MWVPTNGGFFSVFQTQNLFFKAHTLLRTRTAFFPEKIFYFPASQTSVWSPETLCFSPRFTFRGPKTLVWGTTHLRALPKWENGLTPPVRVFRVPTRIRGRFGFRPRVPPPAPKDLPGNFPAPDGPLGWFPAPGFGHPRIPQAKGLYLVSTRLVPFGAIIARTSNLNEAYRPPVPGGALYARFV